MGFEAWTLVFDSAIFALAVWIAAWGVDFWRARARRRG
jgi:hypothetical protein